MVIDPKRMLAELMELARIPSPSRREGAMATAVMGKLRALGLRPRQDRAHKHFGGETGNIIARLPGSRRGQGALLLNAHLDTVPQAQPTPRIAGKYVVSATDAPFGADDKVGVVAILEALRCVSEDGLEHPPLEIIFTVAEEAGLLGARALERSQLRADLGYAFDSGGRVGRVVTRAPSHDVLTVLITGRAAHAGVAPEKGVNAIAIAARAVAGMRLGRIDEETTANIGVIEGGVATNVVPERVRIRGEARSHDQRKLDRQLKHMLRRFHDAACAAGASIEIEIEPQYRSFDLAPDSPAVQVARAAVTRIGRRIKLDTTGGGSDANIFNTHGLPTAIIGCAMDDPHSPSERMEVAELEPLARLAVALIQAAAL
jgi:tripeptide aminopeptidase